MKITKYKLRAKRIINENIGSCILASLIIILPRFFFVAECATLLFLFYTGNITYVVAALGAAAAFLMLLPLNALCIPVGELMLFRLVKAENENEDEYGYEPDASLKSVLKTLRSFGIANLLKLRAYVIGGFLRDAVASLIPAVILMYVLFFYAGSSPVPVGAFVVTAIGFSLIFIFSAVELILEYNKYRFVYSCLPECNGDIAISPAEIIAISKGIASDRVDTIRKCEISFWGWQVLCFFLLPLIFPILYLISYKKLTVYVSAEAAPVPKKPGLFSKLNKKFLLYTAKRRMSLAETAEISIAAADDKADTVVFSLNADK